MQFRLTSLYTTSTSCFTASSPPYPSPTPSPSTFILFPLPLPCPLLGGELLLDLQDRGSGLVSEFDLSLGQGGDNGALSSNSRSESDFWLLSLGRGNDGSSSISLSSTESKSSPKSTSRASSVVETAIEHIHTLTHPLILSKLWLLFDCCFLVHRNLGTAAAAALCTRHSRRYCPKCPGCTMGESLFAYKPVILLQGQRAHKCACCMQRVKHFVILLSNWLF